MDLLVYIPAKDQAGRRLQNLVGHLEWQGTVEIFQTLKPLISRLMTPSGEEAIALLLAATRKDLQELINLEALFYNRRLILILPDLEEEIIAQGHRLRPRYVAFREGDFSDIALVLEKMQRAESPSPYLIRGERPPLKGASAKRTRVPYLEE